PRAGARNRIEGSDRSAEHVFRNLGGAKFQAMTEEAGLSAQPPAQHRGSAVGNLNSDGRLDVVTIALSAPAELWLNDSPGAAHWLELKLEGTASNRDGIRRPNQGDGRRPRSV